MLDLLAFLAALGCGLIAGVFYAFSSFVMPALARLPAAQGISAMQSINVMAVRPPFLAGFLGTAALCAAALAGAFWGWGEPGASALALGALLYLVGTLLVTMVCNVPRNNRLAPLSPDAAESAAYWADYLANWTYWNHIRSAAALLACAACIAAVAQRW